MRPRKPASKILFTEDCVYEIVRENTDLSLPIGVVRCFRRAMLSDLVTSLREASVFEPGWIARRSSLGLCSVAGNHDQRRPRPIDRFAEFIERSGLEVVCNGVVLHRERMGWDFAGSYQHVQRFCKALPGAAEMFGAGCEPSATLLRSSRANPSH